MSKSRKDRDRYYREEDLKPDRKEKNRSERKKKKDLLRGVTSYQDVNDDLEEDLSL